MNRRGFLRGLLATAAALQNLDSDFEAAFGSALHIRLPTDYLVNNNG